MIGGYILPSRNFDYENIFKQSSSFKANEYLLDTGDSIGWFFNAPNRRLPNKNIFFSQSHLLMVDGVAVVRDSDTKYRFFNPSIDYSYNDSDAFTKCLDKIVSNVNVISANIINTKIVLKFASHRASVGRVWYMQPRDKKGIIICDDYRLLMKMATDQLSIEPMAIYAILNYTVVPDPVTIFKNISSVPVSHFGTFTSDNSHIEINPYFRFNFPETNPCNLETTSNLLQNSAQFLKSIKPILLLSGGVDSTLFAHYLCRDNKEANDISAYFLSFGKEDPQLKFAQEAARKANLLLDTIFMDEKDVLTTINQTPHSYMHPFSDYSTIPTFYMANYIKARHPDGGILIDGTGADGCFGIGDLPLEKIYKIAQLQPGFIKKLSKIAYNNLGLINSQSKVARLLSIMSRSEKDIQLVPFVSDLPDSLVSREVTDHFENIDSVFLRFYNSCTDSGEKNTVFKSRVTVADFLTTCQTAALKDFNVGREPLIEVVYPYLWKDILIEGGSLSWDCKTKDGIVKWPLKKLLEKYMANEFIYRKKSGFTPPLSNWLLQKEVYNLFRDTILRPNAYISNVIEIKNVKKLIDGLPKYNRPIPAAVLSFLWGGLFTELWLQENYKPLTPGS